MERGSREAERAAVGHAREGEPEVGETSGDSGEDRAKATLAFGRTEGEETRGGASRRRAGDAGGGRGGVEEPKPRARLSSWWTREEPEPTVVGRHRRWWHHKSKEPRGQR